MNADQHDIEIQGQQRISLLRKIEDFLEFPMLVLSFVWLGLMILEFTKGLSPFLETINLSIWAIFVLDFAVKLWVSPKKLVYIRRNWITAVALLFPALRIFRAARAVRILRLTAFSRGARLARVFTSLNRGISALGKSLGRRGFGYVLALTLLVTLAGGAGIFAFEKDSGNIPDYATALWWTAMVLTTMGSDFFPKTPEGKLLCLFLALYGFTVFGYVTAGLATFFVSRDAADGRSDIPSQTTLNEIKKEIELLRNEIIGLREKG